ncbi:MAG: GrpB family protein [Bacillota bacterium]|uniref:Uncharacterized protein n=1 Tax=Virgibacillus salarius TaxID=447199 RepID=A0A941DZD3_9BACI|nr:MULTISPECIES: GrpB family protein [Bacillaceae]NAZ08842.1 hypothetical protein [Agaribacter marinus]MBR7796133.1 hypothetical protein [Virgibacillus salarius]MCC2252228.1 hypothetical protein [Virgibacillus sp. AGTR]MDY7042898.1 GrpB family protein [Virgibacillus sp. M23]QRZ18898.1 hypothetical protein JUJ52_03975 [Virgibacillus sp. AGTR]
MKVRLTDYDKKWVQMFEQEARFLRELLGSEITTYKMKNLPTVRFGRFFCHTQF